MRVQDNFRSRRWRAALSLSVAIALLSTAAVTFKLERGVAAQTSSYPQPPSDRTLIYVADEKNALAALPFETATTPLRVAEVARNNKMSYLELQGLTSATTLRTMTPRFYLFIKDQQGVRPAFIVRLTNKKKTRRAGATAQKGLSGFGVPAEEIIKPRLLVLGREDGMLFMEVRPREPLLPGEYAFVGADLSRVATFSIAPDSNP